MPRIVIIINGVRKEVVLPDKKHLDAQIAFPHLVQKNKKKYNRKQKHKKGGNYND